MFTHIPTQTDVFGHIPKKVALISDVSAKTVRKCIVRKLVNYSNIGIDCNLTEEQYVKLLWHRVPAGGDSGTCKGNGDFSDITYFG